MLKLKALAAAAPLTVDDIPREDDPTPPVIGAANEVAAIPGQYQNYWFSGLGRNNGGSTDNDNPRIYEVAHCHNVANWGYMYGEPPGTIFTNFGDNSRADAICAYDGNGSSRPYIGIKGRMRYVAIGCMFGAQFRLQVNGVNRPYIEPMPGNNRYVTWDLGELGPEEPDRKVLIVGQGDGACFFSTLTIEDGAVFEPWDFTQEHGGLWAGRAGDSYIDINDANMGFVDMSDALIGLLGNVVTGRGSTGYQRNAGNVGWAMVEPDRLDWLIAQNAPLHDIQLAINDDVPRDTQDPDNTNPDIDTLDAITQVLTALVVTGKPLIVQSPWAPNEANAQNPGGKYQIITNHMIETLRTLDGEWIWLDGVNGYWETSTGKQRPTVGPPWQTGTGYVGNEKGDGNGDTWVDSGGTHPTVPVGITGLSNRRGAELRAAIAAF